MNESLTKKNVGCARQQTNKETSDCFIYTKSGCYYTCTLYRMHYVQGNLLSSTKVKGSYLLLTAYTHGTTQMDLYTITIDMRQSCV